MRVRYRFVAGLALALSVVACSGSEKSQSSAPAVKMFDGDCSSLASVPTFEDLEMGILPICRECHSASVTGDARHGAPPGLDFDTYDVLQSVADTASYLVSEREMPFPSGEGPTDEERNQLYEWAACGTPR
jgi:uncharacterized membrane protein